jgi:NAD(P)-dependent dehydrogenase (short-subunit alcohol dehydrogenase family)
MSRFDLSGRVAIVTGGSEGIGKGIAFGLAQAGARIVVAARRQELIAQAVEELNQAGAEAIGLQTDVTNASDVRNMAAKTLEKYGRIDILVNNAGGSKGSNFNRGPLLELTEDDLDGAVALNVRSVFLCCKAVVPVMMEQKRGSIVNISSIAGLEAYKDYGFYGATKAAVNNLTGNMAIEWAPYVRVNAVLPGHIETPRTSELRSPERLAQHISKIAMGRMGTPEDIAGAVVYLASDAAEWTTGETIRINGGHKD